MGIKSFIRNIQQEVEDEIRAELIAKGRAEGFAQGRAEVLQELRAMPLHEALAILGRSSDDLETEHSDNGKSQQD